MTLFKSLLLLTALLLIGFLSSCSEDSTSSTPQEYIADDNSFAGYTNWTLEATKTGNDPALSGVAHGANDSTVTRKIYIKDGQSRVNGQYPVGTRILKHSLNTSGTINVRTAMVKRGNNFNATGGNWEWFLIDADGKIAVDDKGAKQRGANLLDGLCIGCHAGATSKDFVFSKQ